MRHDEGMGDVEYGKIYDFYLPPSFLRLYDGPAVNVEDMWRILGKGTSNGVSWWAPSSSQARPAAQAFRRGLLCFWQGGDFIKNDPRPCWNKSVK